MSESPLDVGAGAPWGESVDEAYAAVLRLQEKAAEFAAELAARGAELADLERRSGAEAFEDVELAASLGDDLARLRGRVDVLTRAVETAEQRIVEAKRLVLHEQAAELRMRAAERVTAAVEHAERTSELLGLLEEHEGVVYGVVPHNGLDGMPLVGAAPLTRSARMRGDAGRLLVSAWACTEVADHGVLPRFTPDHQQLPVADLPGTVWGPLALLQACSCPPAERPGCRLHVREGDHINIEGFTRLAQLTG